MNNEKIIAHPDDFRDFCVFKNLHNMQSLRFKAIDNLTSVNGEVSVESPAKITVPER